MKIYVLDDTQGLVRGLRATRVLGEFPVKLEVLTQHIASEDALVERLQDADAIVLIRERTILTANVINALPRLRLVVQTGRLSSAIDVSACEKRGIAVRDGSGSPIAPAELTWALILAARRHLMPYMNQMMRGNWQRTSENMEDEMIGSVLHGRTLGIWALGRIGSRVAAYGKAFGMRVLVHGRQHSQQAAEEAGYEFIEDRRMFLSQLDVLSLHLKLNSATRHMVTVEDLASMKADALLVNTSRAELIAPGALLAALDRGHPGSAALDVFEDEPDGVASYLSHPGVLCSPHLGFVESDTYENYFREAFSQVIEFVMGKSQMPSAMPAAQI